MIPSPTAELDKIYHDMHRSSSLPDRSLFVNNIKNAIRKEISDSIHKYDILNRQNHASAAKDIIMVSNSLSYLKESIAELKESNLESEMREFKEIMENILRHLDQDEDEDQDQETEKEIEIEKIKILYGSIVGIFLSFGFIIMFLPLLKHI